MPEAHATLSASGSVKWLSCPAALALEAIIDAPDTGNEYSDEGDAAHKMLYEALAHGRDLKEFLGLSIVINEDTPQRKMVWGTQEMIDNVEIVIDYVQRLSARNSFYEEKVDYSHIAPNGFGTGDVILEVYEKLMADKRVNTLYVIDFKYGKGIRVDAIDNSQGMLYALGALNSLEILFDKEIKRIVIVIVQPRMDNISEFEISVDDLLKWGEKIKPKAELAYKIYDSVDYETYNDTHPDNISDVFKPEHFNPTKKGCQWCQGRRLKRCKAHAQTGFSAAIEGFDDLTDEQKSDLPAIEVSDRTIKDPAFLDSADLVTIYLNIQLFLSFAADLDIEIANRIHAGETGLGLKLIATEKPRAWKDDEDATIKAIRTAGLQKQDYLKWSLISPTEAEKTLKEVKPKDHKRRYKRLEVTAIHRPPGKDRIIEDKNKPVEKAEGVSLQMTEDDLLGFDLLE